MKLTALIETDGVISPRVTASSPNCWIQSRDKRRLQATLPATGGGGGGGGEEEKEEVSPRLSTRRWQTHIRHLQKTFGLTSEGKESGV